MNWPHAVIGGIGVLELLVVLFVILLFFGARRLPELGEALGRGIRAARDAVSRRDARAEEERPELGAGPREEPATPPERERDRTDPPGR
jgi:sec-independent protein translocase protein TatA